jgi:hypothetical protein
MVFAFLLNFKFSTHFEVPDLRYILMVSAFASLHKPQMISSHGIYRQCVCVCVCNLPFRYNRIYLYFVDLIQTAK